MSLFGLLGLVLILFGIYILVTGGIILGIVCIVVGLVIASWSGRAYY